jgi:prepilin-type N-terminal cleavage/methylation domain-containing protein
MPKRRVHSHQPNQRSNSAGARVLAGPGRRSRAAHAGFVLWEMMLALMIFCVVAVSLTTALRQAIDTVILLRDDAQTRHDFENLLNEAAVTKLQPGKEDLIVGDGRIHYEREVVRLQPKTVHGELVPNLYDVTIRAIWQAGGQTRTSQVRFVIYQSLSG